MEEALLFFFLFIMERSHKTDSTIHTNLLGTLKVWHFSFVTNICVRFPLFPPFIFCARKERKRAVKTIIWLCYKQTRHLPPPLLIQLVASFPFWCVRSPLAGAWGLQKGKKDSFIHQERQFHFIFLYIKKQGGHNKTFLFLIFCIVLTPFLLSMRVPWGFPVKPVLPPVQSLRCCLLFSTRWPRSLSFSLGLFCTKTLQAKEPSHNKGRARRERVLYISLWRFIFLPEIWERNETKPALALYTRTSYIVLRMCDQYMGLLAPLFLFSEGTQPWEMWPVTQSCPCVIPLKYTQPERY